MIKSVFAAHLSEKDKQDLTLLIDDRPLGSLSEEDKSNFVLTASRDVHTMSGFSNRSFYYDPRFNKDRIRLWAQIFREMQSRGLKILPDFIKNHHIYTEFLYLFNSEIFIGWQDRTQGLYLWRKNRLFRLQPTILPNNIFDAEWMNHADFYSFNLKQGDMVFSISEKIFSRLNPNKIEDYFNGKANLPTIINEIISKLRVYYDDLDLTWFGFQVERLDKNIFAEENQSHLRKKNDFTNLINSSRVSRVKDGQELIPAPKIKPSDTNYNFQDTDEILIEYKLNEEQKSSTEMKSKFKNNQKVSDRDHRLYNLEKLEKRRTENDVFWDDVKSFSFEPIIQNFKKAMNNIFNFIPDQPVLSKLIVTAAVLLIILFVFMLGRTIGSNNTQVEETQVQESTFETRKMKLDDEVKAPDSALIEVEITVKANNLQVRQEPKTDAAIVATVQRGSKITQLTEPENNWVYVRLSDGKTFGYVYAESLLAEE